MPNQTLHFQKFNCSADTFKSIRAAMKEAAWEPGNTRGFGTVGEDPNEIHGALYAERAFTLKRVFDPNKRTEEDETVRRLTRARFIINFTRGTIAFYERTGMKGVVEALDGLPNITFGLADFKLDVFEVLNELGQSYNETQIERLGIGDYMERTHALTADVAFKPSENGKAWDAVNAYKKQLRAFAVTIKHGKKANGTALKVKVAVNERGAVTFSDNVPTEMRDHVLGMLQRFDMDKDAQPERYGVGKSEVDLAIDRHRAETVLKHSKDEGAKSLARTVIDAIDAEFQGRATGKMDEAVRAFRKAAKKLGGVEIVAGGKSVKVG